jgi:hypothetical protein
VLHLGLEEISAVTGNDRFGGVQGVQNSEFRLVGRKGKSLIRHAPDWLEPFALSLRSIALTMSTPGDDCHKKNH